MKKILSLTVFILTVLVCGINAQTTGIISGTVLDKSNNDVLIGANVVVPGTDFGASTDLDGKFVIKGLTPGKYNIRVSFISYQTVNIENVEVKAGQTTTVNVPLAPSATELEEVVVTAEALSNSEGAVLKIQKNSDEIVDGISAELISKNNSSDGTDVLKRMTGVTIADGKFAYIRGVGDRYNNTTLNGANLPSTEPEKKSFSYDIFPAGLIENIVTSKTFTPDKPADFSGGLVQIKTVEFPNKLSVGVSLSSSFNTITTGKDFLSYEGGRRFLGNDDGTRSLPSFLPSDRINISKYSPSQLQEFGRSFKNNWNFSNSSAPLNAGFSLTVGDKFDISNDQVLGFIAAINYSNSNEIQDAERSYYFVETGNVIEPKYAYTGTSYKNSVMLGGMFNVSFKIDGKNKVSLKNIYNQNADDEVTSYSGESVSNSAFRNLYSTRYVTRNLFSSQLIGEHYFSLLSGLNFDWNLNYARSNREEPDAKRYIKQRAIEDPTEPMRIQIDQSNLTRFFGDLIDNNTGGSVDFKLRAFENPMLPTFKFGLAYDYKDRKFDARLFGFRNVPGGNFMREDELTRGSIEDLFAPENFTSNFLEIVEITKPSDSYSSEQTIAAGYFAFDYNVTDQIKVITGFRVENSNQKMDSKSLTGEPVKVDQKYNDFLPSLNVVYQPTEYLNVRAAYSRTLARPEFREIAPFSYYDFLENELVQGNPALKRSLITNYDLRLELFPARATELIALSVFYKEFSDPIEQTLVASANEPIRSYANANKAENLGVELEVRKNLDFILPQLDFLSFVGNISYISSKVKFDESGLNGSTFQETERSLQGQADYILNFGLYYDGYTNGFNASVVYNKVGEKIAKVGTVNLGNVVERPRDQVDLMVSQKLFDNWTVKMAVKDLFENDYVQVQKTPAGERVSQKIKKGRDFSVGVSYKF
ncbi:MAG: TonB-dependent receptor [Ignavibacteriaceae bacterium]|nr:TonB-dependent receptor [Ignavibacteriaceae bacterium]